VKGSLAKAVLGEFEKQLRQALPDFKPVTNPNLPSGDRPSVCRLYGYKVGETLSLYVHFQTHRSEDSFTVEIAWSRHDQGPLPFMVNPPSHDDAAHREAARFRLGRLWVSRDVWWDVASVAVAPAQVKDAVMHLAREGLSYFSSVAGPLSLRLKSGEDVC
jgi:hypothetical protein